MKKYNKIVAAVFCVIFFLSAGINSITGTGNVEASNQVGRTLITEHKWEGSTGAINPTTYTRNRIGDIIRTVIEDTEVVTGEQHIIRTDIYGTTYEFNEEGKLKRYTYFDKNGDLLREISYDESGRCTENTYSNGELSVTKEYDEFGIPSVETIFNMYGWTKNEYDSFGNLKIETDYYNGALESEHEYDNDGNIVRGKLYYDDGRWEEYTREYDNNTLIREMVTRSDGVWHEYVLDDYYNWILLKSNEFVEEKDLWTKYEYDGRGRKISEIIYGKNGDAISDKQQWSYYGDGKQIMQYTTCSGNSDIPRYREIYTYDKFGNQIKKEIYTSSEPGNLYFSAYFEASNEYDDKGIVKGTENYYELDADTGSFILKSHVKDYKRDYDKFGNIRMVEYNIDGYAEEKRYPEVNEYTDNGRIMKYILYDSDGEIINWGESETDDNGNIIRETSYSSETGEVSRYTQYKYDEKRNIIWERIWERSSDPYNSLSENETWYDASGRILKQLWYGDDGSISSGYEYEYDSYGRKTLEKNIIIGNDGIKTHRYIYDSYGNLIKEKWEYEYVTEEYTYTFYPYENYSLLSKEELGFTDESGSPMVLENKNLEWNDVGGKSYWYENGIKQGTYFDPNGVIGDETIRGREVYDKESDAWYWLDANADGAKAEGKEVWMPYIYQDEGTWDEDRIRKTAYEESDEHEEAGRA